MIGRRGINDSMKDGIGFKTILKSWAVPMPNHLRFLDRNILGSIAVITLVAVMRVSVG